MGRSNVAVVVILLVMGVLFVMRVSLLDSLFEGAVFHPSPGATAGIAEAFGIDADDVHLVSEDGVKLHAYFLPALRGAGDGHARSRAILFLHGNAGNASDRLPNAVELARLDCAVLVLDYRGFGWSEGSPSERGSYLDARAALANLIERGFPNRSIVVFGRSLGGAVAVDLVRDHPVAGVILESTFSSMADVAGRIGGPILSFLAGSRFDSIAKISGVRAPLLFFHGNRDEVIDYSLGQRLFEAAPQPKAFETIDGAGHNDTTLVGGRPYFERIRRFIDEVAPGRDRS